MRAAEAQHFLNCGSCEMPMLARYILALTAFFIRFPSLRSGSLSTSGQLNATTSTVDSGCGPAVRFTSYSTIRSDHFEGPRCGLAGGLGLL